jgi:hypothetical protein
MNFRKTSSLLIIFYISVAIFSHACRVEASRVLSEDFGSAAHLETYSSIYERAKLNMAYSSGRSPSGGPSTGDNH